MIITLRMGKINNGYQLVIFEGVGEGGTGLPYECREVTLLPCSCVMRALCGVLECLVCWSVWCAGVSGVLECLVCWSVWCAGVSGVLECLLLQTAHLTLPVSQWLLH